MCALLSLIGSCGAGSGMVGSLFVTWFVGADLRGFLNGGGGTMFCPT